MRRLTQNLAVITAGTYLIFSVFYILLSDQLLAVLITDAENLTTWQTLKGWAFVLISSGLIFAILTRVARAQRAAELHTRSLNRLYAVLSEVNQAITHERNIQALYERICAIVVERGGLRMAWIGLLDETTRTVQPVAHAGVVDGYLDNLQIVLDDSPAGRGPTASALREQQHMIVNDIAADPRMALWRSKALALGYRASAAFPIIVGAQFAGALNLYASEVNAFDADEISLLDKLAMDIAFAVEFHAQDVQRRIFEQERGELIAQLEQRVALRTAELEVALQAAQTADRLKSAFLATMSHELRTPLNSIIGFSGVLLQGMAGPLNAEQSKQLGMVQTSAHHLLALINDVLDISKIEAGQLEIMRSPFDLRSAIETALRTVTPLAEKKGLALAATMDSNVGVMVSDRRRVEQIMLNLLNNAIKFTEHGEVRIACKIEGDRVAIDVQDTGIGIRAEDMDKLFQPFQQIETGLARRHEGTGLGLSICHSLATLLGGNITVASEWGGGSTFTVNLPFQDEGVIDGEHPAHRR